MTERSKTIKFHGQEVQNVLLRYLQKGLDKLDITSKIEFDARNNNEDCQTINVQVVSDFITITFYKDEKSNLIIRRELIPTHRVEHIEVKDLIQE